MVLNFVSGPGRGRDVFGGHYAPPELAVWCKHAVVANQIDPGPGHQGGELGNEIQWFEQEVRGAIGIGVFKGVAQFALIGDRQPLHCQRWPCDIAAESFEFAALMGLSGDGCVH